VVNKTIMRKKNFGATSKVIKVWRSLARLVVSSR
jgi:hypothetical protein